MNRTDSKEKRLPSFSPPQYGKHILRTLLALVIYHAVGFLLYSFLLAPLEEQMIMEQYPDHIIWVAFAYNMLLLTALGIVMGILYYRNEAREKMYLRDTSVDRFGHKWAAKGALRHDLRLLWEALITAGFTAILWLPSILVPFLVKQGTLAGSWTSVAGVLDSMFIGVTGLFHPFDIPWIGYGIGVVYVALLHVVAGFIVHRKWDDHQYE